MSRAHPSTRPCASRAGAWQDTERSGSAFSRTPDVGAPWKSTEQPSSSWQSRAFLTAGEGAVLLAGRWPPSEEKIHARKECEPDPYSKVGNNASLKPTAARFEQHPACPAGGYRLSASPAQIQLNFKCFRRRPAIAPTPPALVHVHPWAAAWST